MATTSEQRAHRRVECFLVPVEREALPVWVFKPPAAPHGIAGLVMNLSDGGLQVLTPVDDPLVGDHAEVQLLLGEDDTVPRFRARVTRVWTGEHIAAGCLSGWRFDEPASSAEDFIRNYQAGGAARRWVRCLLLPD